MVQVIQGQSHSANRKPRWFPIWPPLCPTLHLSPTITVFEVFDAKFPWSNPGRFSHPEVMVPIDSPRVVSYSTSINPIIVSVTVFKVFDVQIQWPWTRRVQGHPQSKVIVPIKSPLVVSYLTSIVPNIISLIVFEIFYAKFQWSRSRMVQGHARSNVVVPMVSMGGFLFDLLWVQHCISHHYEIWR